MRFAQEDIYNSYYDNQFNDYEDRLCEIMDKWNVSLDMAEHIEFFTPTDERAEIIEYWNNYEIGENGTLKQFINDTK